MKPILGQIIRLTKSILLEPDEPGRYPSSQFIPGKPAAQFATFGAALSWWYSSDTFHAFDAVAELTINSSPQFRDCDRESAAKVVARTIEEVCIDHALFDVDAVFFGTHKTLFECCRVPVPHFAEAVLRKVQLNLAATIGRRCTIYSVPRLQPPSFFLPQDSIRVIAKGDEAAWQSLVDEGYRFGEWSPSSPRLGLGQGRELELPADYECILVAEEDGTPDGARFSSVLRFRKLLAVMVSVTAERTGRTPSLSMAPPFSFCMQFPHTTASDINITRQDCKALLPYYISDVQVTPGDAARIRNWYEDCTRCGEALRNRVEKAANFLNRAMNADDIEAYINYFVALDALFGERGSVEASILEGVTRLGLDPSYSDKASWLFDFRNEIVHGGSRYISECPRYDDYVRHFQSKPTADVQRLAQLAVLKAPQVFAV